MRKPPLRLLPVAMVLVAAVALPAAALANVAPNSYTTPGFNPAGKPTSGTHLATGSATPTCTVADNLDISCNSWSLGGVGNTDATLNLVAHYNESVSCTNGGQNTVAAQAATAQSGPTTVKPNGKNGSLTVPTASVTAPVVGSSFKSGKNAPCPNSNWTATILTVSLHDFDYTLTFGTLPPVVEISATDP